MFTTIKNEWDKIQTYCEICNTELSVKSITVEIIDKVDNNEEFLKNKRNVWNARYDILLSCLWSHGTAQIDDKSQDISLYSFLQFWRDFFFGSVLAFVVVSLFFFSAGFRVCRYIGFTAQFIWNQGNYHLSSLPHIEYKV